MTHLKDLSKVYLEQVASQETQEEGYKPIDKKKESAMYRRAGNLARTSLSSKGKKKEEAQDKSSKIVSAIARQKEKERFDRIGKDPKHQNNYNEEVETVDEAVKGQDTEMRKAAAADRKSGEKRLPPSKGKGYADQQKQSISYMDKLTKKNKNVVGLVAKEALDPVGREDADIDNDGDTDKSDKYLHKRRKAIAAAMKKRVKEERELAEIHAQAHKPHEVPSGNLKGLVSKAVKRIDTDVDGDTDNNDKAKGELGEFIPGVGNKRLYSSTGTKTAKESKYYDPMDDEDFDHDEAEKNRGVSGKNNPKGGKSLSKKKSVKESFSNWRQDLSEVMDDGESEKKIKEKKVNNKVKINPNLGEAIEEIGGTLIEMVEIDEFDYIVESVYDELLEEGYEEDDVEEAIEYALTEAKVTFGHDTKKPKSAEDRIGAVARLARQKLKKYAKKAVVKGARAVASGASKLADKVEGKPKTTYRGEGVGRKERVGVASKPQAKTSKVKAKKKKSSKLDDLIASVRNEQLNVQEKMNLKKSEMGDVVKDFYKSDAPQFKGKSKEKRREMAIAAKLTAERGGRKLKEGATEAPMSQQEIALQKRKTTIDQQIARKRQQELNKSKVNEEQSDRARDERQMRGGVDGNVDYRRPSAKKLSNAELGIKPGKTAVQKAMEKKGKSALDIVKANVRSKYGKGSLM